MLAKKKNSVGTLSNRDRERETDMSLVPNTKETMWSFDAIFN